MPEPADNPHAFSADGITLRAELPSDGPFLFALYAGTRQAELDLTGWNAATREAFLQMQFRAMRAGYAQTYPKAAFSLILRTGVPIGRQVIDHTEECLRVVDIALLPAWQNQGIGASLLNQILAEAAAAAKAVRLQVLRGSRALRLYERLGFQPAGDNGIYLELEWRAPTAPD